MTSLTQPTISVIVVNFNSGAFLGLCIDRIRKSTTAVELIVVDNNSSDISKSRVLGRRRESTVRYIRNEQNLGFSAAVNIGATVASGELLVVINPDCLVWPHSIDRLCRSLDDQQEVGLVGGLVFGIHGREQSGCRRYDVTPIRSIGKMLGKLFPLEFIPTIDMTREPFPQSSVDVDAVSGSFFAVRKSVYNELGGLDEDYFLHFEDLDFCRRVRNAGYRVVFNPNVSVIHVGAVSSGVKSVEIARYKHHSLKIYFQKHLSQYSVAARVVSIMSQMYVLLTCLYEFIEPKTINDNCFDRVEGISGETNIGQVLVIGDQCQLLLSVVKRLAARGYNVVVETNSPQAAPKIPDVSWVASEYRAKLPKTDHPKFAWSICLGTNEQLKDYQRSFAQQISGSELLIETGVGTNDIRQGKTDKKAVGIAPSGDWLLRGSLCLRFRENDARREDHYNTHKNNELAVFQGLRNEISTRIDNDQRIHVDDISELCLDLLVGISAKESDDSTHQTLNDVIDRFNRTIRSLYE